MFMTNSFVLLSVDTTRTTKAVQSNPNETSTDASTRALNPKLSEDSVL